MERRRGSILRIETSPGVFHENCPITVDGCEVWKPYKNINVDTGLDEWNDQVEICEDSLFDLDYFNRILVAQVANPFEETFGDPPKLIDEDNAPDVWYVNPQFELSEAPDSGVSIVYVQMSLWLLGPLVTLDDLSLVSRELPLLLFLCSYDVHELILNEMLLFYRQLLSTHSSPRTFHIQLVRRMLKI